MGNILNADGTFTNTDITLNSEGKPVFTGKERVDPIKDKAGDSSKLECPTCHQLFDYLLGETDTMTGEKQGCEVCYKPSTIPKKEQGYEGTKEITFN